MEEEKEECEKEGVVIRTEFRVSPVLLSRASRSAFESFCRKPSPSCPLQRGPLNFPNATVGA